MPSYDQPGASRGASAANARTITLPPGYTLDPPSNFTDAHQPLPPGYTLDEPQSQQAPTPTLWDKLKDLAASVPTGSLESLAATAATQGRASQIEMGGSDDANNMPTDRQAFDALEQNVTGPLHKPQTGFGRVGETVGEFVGNPGTYVAPGGFLRNAAQSAVAGAASELAGQATQGTAAELPARMAGAMLAPSSLSRAPENALPTIDDLRNAADRSYADARQMQASVTGSHAAGWAGGTVTQLARDGMNDKLAPQTHAVLQELGTTPQNGAVSLDNLETVRRTLGEVAGNYSNPTDAEAASRAMNGLDDMVTNLQPQNVAAGDAQGAANAWATARANYAAMKRAETVTNLANVASLNTDAAVRQDIGNATRQQFKKLLTSDSAGRGFSGDELAQVENIVRGTPWGNTLRTLSSAVGGGSGLAQGLAIAAGGYAGSQTGGPEGAGGGAMVPLILGAIARRGAAGSVLSQVDKLDEMVRARSPLAQQIADRLAAAGPQQRPLSSVDRIRNVALAAALAQRYAPGQPYSPLPVMAGGDAVK